MAASPIKVKANRKGYTPGGTYVMPNMTPRPFDQAAFNKQYRRAYIRDRAIRRAAWNTGYYGSAALGVGAIVGVHYGMYKLAETATQAHSKRLRANSAYQAKVAVRIQQAETKRAAKGKQPVPRSEKFIENQRKALGRAGYNKANVERVIKLNYTPKSGAKVHARTAGARVVKAAPRAAVRHAGKKATRGRPGVRATASAGAAAKQAAMNRRKSKGGKKGRRGHPTRGAGGKFTGWSS